MHISTLIQKANHKQFHKNLVGLSSYVVHILQYNSVLLIGMIGDAEKLNHIIHLLGTFL